MIISYSEETWIPSRNLVIFTEYWNNLLFPDIKKERDKMRRGEMRQLYFLVEQITMRGGEKMKIKIIIKIYLLYFLLFIMLVLFMCIL